MMGEKGRLVSPLFPRKLATRGQEINSRKCSRKRAETEVCKGTDSFISAGILLKLCQKQLILEICFPPKWLHL